MKYDSVWEPTAIKKIKKLEKKDTQRILKKVNEIEHNPRNYLKHLKNTRFYRLRVGDYRLVIELIPKTMKMHIHNLGHRKKIYKRK